MAYAVKDCQIFGPGVEGGCEIRRRGPNAFRGIAQPGPGEMLRTLLAQRFYLKRHRKRGKRLSTRSQESTGTLRRRATKTAPGPRGPAVCTRLLPPLRRLRTCSQKRKAARCSTSRKSRTVRFRFDFAFREKLGLRSERRPMPMEVWVVDQAERTPTEN